MLRSNNIWHSSPLVDLSTAATARWQTVSAGLLLFFTVLWFGGIAHHEVWRVSCGPGPTFLASTALTKDTSSTTLRPSGSERTLTTGRSRSRSSVCPRGSIMRSMMKMCGARPTTRTMGRVQDRGPSPALVSALPRVQRALLTLCRAGHRQCRPRRGRASRRRGRQILLAAWGWVLLLRALTPDHVGELRCDGHKSSTDRR